MRVRAGLYGSARWALSFPLRCALWCCRAPCVAALRAAKTRAVRVPPLTLSHKTSAHRRARGRSRCTTPVLPAAPTPGPASRRAEKKWRDVALTPDTRAQPIPGDGRRQGCRARTGQDHCGPVHRHTGPVPAPGGLGGAQGARARALGESWTHPSMGVCGEESTPARAVGALCPGES